MEDRYVFKYDKNGDLYKYIEYDTEKKKHIISYYILDKKKNALIRYDKRNMLKHFIKYDKSEDVIMTQRFEAGESWITIMKRPGTFGKDVFYSNPNFYHFLNKDYIKEPQKIKEIILKNNMVYRFKVNRRFVNNWKKAIKTEEPIKESIKISENEPKFNIFDHLHFTETA